MPADTHVDLVPTCSSPTSDIDSLVFDSSSDGVHTPNEQRSPAVPTFDAAKGIASVGVTVHSPPARFIGTPFTTGNGPNSLFEYPFPATRPALSNTSSISSVASSLLGPPSPSTRAKFIPRISPQQSSRRRVSGGGVAQVRVPPRLRTDSGGSVGSNASQGGEDSGSTSTPKPSRMSPATRPVLAQSRLRDRSGSLGVLPIALPPPTITTVGVGAPSAGPMSPATLLGAMAATGTGASVTPRSDCEADESESEAISVTSGKRRASLPAMFAPQLNEDSDSDSSLDREDVEDHPDPSPSTPLGITQ
ncbi:unnamed protein product [Rhizoctonia solani]|uniref:Uncharacterized protein n=1 Tax=Rhizoctonia solani TaxID=456999 RepID=A0A8H3AB06_9AGAM|nr:unnamed protein product [Rhizoctonia solani]CAE6526173.1 unnamed protein product [Rhizoctonia solani]